MGVVDDDRHVAYSGSGVMTVSGAGLQVHRRFRGSGLSASNWGRRLSV